MLRVMSAAAGNSGRCAPCVGLRPPFTSFTCSLMPAALSCNTTCCCCRSLSGCAVCVQCVQWLATLRVAGSRRLRAGFRRRRHTPSVGATETRVGPVPQRSEETRRTHSRAQRVPSQQMHSIASAGLEHSDFPALQAKRRRKEHSDWIPYCC